MSTRFYPRFVRGNPQLRIFLPDWKLILVKTKRPTPCNVIEFKVDPRMTDWDIKNYLEKIYKVRVGAVNSNIMSGDLVLSGRNLLSKKDDYKIARVTLTPGESFTWPDLFPADKMKETLNEYEITMKELKKNRTRDPNVKDIPTWFG